MSREQIITPRDASLDLLCDQLTRQSSELGRTGDWPSEQLRLCGEAGVYAWFAPREWDGQQWSEPDIVRGYLRLSAACLTTAFIITQRTGAFQRIAGSDNDAAQKRLLPSLVAGQSFATVGISHLTTSRRHLGRPVLRARAVEDGFVLDGYSPWVTGADHASIVVTGAVLDDDRQILVALPTDLPGVSVPPPPRLVGLSASHTGEVHLDGVRLDREWLLAGPIENVMQIGTGAGTGGLQTSTLALGLSSAALDYLDEEARNRPTLAGPADEMRREHVELQSALLALAGGESVCTNERLRARANSIALRTTQAALAAAKGSGYVVGHPAGRWAREALFFLVWSCPQGVMAANLCELAGME